MYADDPEFVSESEISHPKTGNEVVQFVSLQCIVPGNADGIHDHTLHWVVVYGYENDVFSVCDSLSSKIKLTTEELEGYMDTPIGRIYISVSDCTDKTGEDHAGGNI